MNEKVVKITAKGQATIPKAWRDAFGFADKAIVTPTAQGVLFRPLPHPEEERGSLRSLFDEQAAKDVLEEARREDVRREERLERM